MIPTEKECIELQNRFHMFENIKKHSAKVARVGVYVAQCLENNGYDVDVSIVNAAGLLHDITKAHQLVNEASRRNDYQQLEIYESLSPVPLNDVLQQWKDMCSLLNLNDDLIHPYSGAKLLSYLGFREISDIVEKHIEPLVEISNTGVICYADRLVGLNIVTLDERFDYIEQKYGNYTLRRPSKELEKVLLSAAKIKFEDIKQNC
ncbi:HDIG domain-containing protein [Candidatus Woesearchaeota archaeon]|nr:MAG: HDIG domain-containing protein [Candidatus Woesearchaeota archaeon]